MCVHVYMNMIKDIHVHIYMHVNIELDKHKKSQVYDNTTFAHMWSQNVTMQYNFHPDCEQNCVFLVLQYYQFRWICIYGQINTHINIHIYIYVYLCIYCIYNICYMALCYIICRSNICSIFLYVWYFAMTMCHQIKFRNL